MGETIRVESTGAYSAADSLQKQVQEIQMASGYLSKCYEAFGACKGEAADAAVKAIDMLDKQFGFMRDALSAQSKHIVRAVDWFENADRDLSARLEHGSSPSGSGAGTATASPADR